MSASWIAFEGKTFPIDTHGGSDPLLARYAAKHAFYEVDLLRAVREHHRMGTMIYDVGANIGNHTLFFAGVLGQKVRAFEPFGPNVTLLTANVEQNGLVDLVSIAPFGLSDEPARADLRASDPNNMGTVQVDKTSDGAIELRRLDDVVPEAEIVGTIKMDIEGHEGPALNGALSVITRHRPDLYVESHTAEEFEMVKALVLPLGYAVVRRYGVTPTYHYRHGDRA